MPFASNFLVPNGTFIVELIAFLVVLFVVGRYLVPPLNKMLRDRQEVIRAELEAADRARAEAAAVDDERRNALEQARQQGREVVDQASRTADQLVADARSRAEEEYERILATAHTEVQMARQLAVEEASERLGEMVLDVVSRIIGREVDAAAHRDLIDEAIAAVRSEDGSGSAASAVGSTP